MAVNMEQELARLNEIAEFVATVKKERDSQKGPSAWVGRNIATIITLAVLSTGIISNYISTKDRVENLEARIVIIENNYVPQKVADARRQMRDEQIDTLTKRLDKIDEKLDVLLYTRGLTPPARGGK